MSFATSSSDYEAPNRLSSIHFNFKEISEKLWTLELNSMNVQTTVYLHTREIDIGWRSHSTEKGLHVIEARFTEQEIQKGFQRQAGYLSQNRIFEIRYYKLEIVTAFILEQVDLSLIQLLISSHEKKKMMVSVKRLNF